VLNETVGKTKNPPNWRIIFAVWTGLEPNCKSLYL